MSRTLLIALALSFPSALLAQKNCTKGKACGNTCIAVSKTCRVGAPTSSPTTPPRAPAPTSAPPVTSQPDQTHSLALVGTVPTTEAAFHVIRRPALNVSFVVVNPSVASSRRTFHTAIGKLCGDLYLNCRLYSFTDAMTVPDGLPLSSASMRLVVAAYEQNGQTGATKLTFYRDGKPID